MSDTSPIPASIKPNPDFGQLRKALLRDGKPAYVPFYELFADPPIMEAMLGKPLPTRASTVEFYYRMGYEHVPTWPGIPWTFGSLVDRSQGYPITDWASFETYPWPDPAAISFAEFESVSPVLPDGMMMVGQTGGVFETAESLLGYEQLCYALIDDPAFVEAIFARIEEIYLPMYRGMAQNAQVGALVISDDLGFKTQTLIGADDIRKYVLPVHTKLAAIAHEAGKPCILHSCGQLAEIMDDLIDDVRIDAKHSYEDAITPVEEIIARYGSRLAILGGFDVDRLCRSSEEEIRAHTRKLLALGADGGYALGTGNSVAKFIPLQNYAAMMDEAWKART
ncbi:MAG: uroporphyrinogen decarboxylase family protein [Armatimonadota bacterium]